MFLDPSAVDLDRERLIRRAARYLASLGGPRGRAPARWSRGTTVIRTCRPPGDVWSAIQTDGEMRRPSDAMAEAHTASGRATFVYRFDEPLAGRLAHLGPATRPTCRTPSGRVDRCGWAEVLGPDAPALADAVQAAWVAFARDGDPSCDELGPWPAYDTDRRATMLLAARSRLVDDPDGARRRRWAELAPIRSDRPS